MHDHVHRVKLAWLRTLKLAGKDGLGVVRDDGDSCMRPFAG